jgi:branched-chain amino acid transport system permease protein
MTLEGHIIQTLVSGLSMGSVYAMVGLGFMVIYSVCGIINFAHGDYVMVGGMVAASLFGSGISLPASILIAIVITLIVGGLSWRIITDPTERTPHMVLILFSIGVAFLVKGAARILWGTDYQSLPYFVDMAPIHVASGTISPQAPWVLGILILVVLSLFFLFDRTLLGKAMRATSEQPTGVKLLGISPTRMTLFAFVLGATVAAIAGVVITPYTMTHYGVGVGFTVKAFICAIVGGVTRVEGVILGGLTLGLLEAVTAGFISSAYKEALPLAIFLVLMLWRPQGLLGRVAAEI